MVMRSCHTQLTHTHTPHQQHPHSDPPSQAPHSRQARRRTSQNPSALSGVGKTTAGRIASAAGICPDASATWRTVLPDCISYPANKYIASKVATLGKTAPTLNPVSLNYLVSHLHKRHVAQGRHILLHDPLWQQISARYYHRQNFSVEEKTQGHVIVHMQR